MAFFQSGKDNRFSVGRPGDVAELANFAHSLGQQRPAVRYIGNQQFIPSVGKSTIGKSPAVGRKASSRFNITKLIDVTVGNAAGQLSDNVTGLRVRQKQVDTK